jgi:hypothetical protein
LKQSCPFFMIGYQTFRLGYQTLYLGYLILISFISPNPHQIRYHLPDQVQNSTWLPATRLPPPFPHIIPRHLVFISRPFPSPYCAQAVLGLALLTVDLRPARSTPPSPFAIKAGSRPAFSCFFSFFLCPTLYLSSLSLLKLLCFQWWSLCYSLPYAPFMPNFWCPLLSFMPNWCSYSLLCPTGAITLV